MGYEIRGSPYRSSRQRMRLCDTIFATKEEAITEMEKQIKAGDMDPRAWVQKTRAKVGIIKPDPNPPIRVY